LDVRPPKYKREHDDESDIIDAYMKAVGEYYPEKKTITA
jgi:hypothetical protein